MKKRLFTFFLALCMLFSLLPISVFAADMSVTYSTAVKWAKAQIGTDGENYDGSDSGVQCVDLIRKYTNQCLKHDIGKTVNGIAADYATQKLQNSSYYTRYDNTHDPLPGDIFVWGKGQYGGGKTTGHVGIITAVDSKGYYYVDYGNHRGPYDKATYKSGLHSFTAIIRPHFQPSTASTYTIGFNLNGGTGSYSAMKIHFGEDLVIPSAAPVKTGSTFLGWNAYRAIDKTWYCDDGNWRTESNIKAKNTTKHLYQPGAYKVNYSWFDGIQGDISYTLYAAWDGSTVEEPTIPPVTVWETVVPGNYRLLNVGTGYTMNYGYGWSGSYNPIIMSDADNSPEQTFTFRYMEAGKYCLMINHSDGGAVNVWRSSGAAQAGDPLSGYKYSGSDLQQFYVTPVEDGYILRSATNTDLVIAAPSDDWHAKLVLQKYSASNMSQRWILEPMDHTHSYTAAVTKPTCTAQGYTTYTCSCGDSYKDNYTAALGHKTELRNAKAATCTAAGYTGDQVCTVCGTTVEKGTSIAALGHAWNSGVVTKQPTETSTGIKTFTCTRCTATKTETIPVLTHTHSYTAAVTKPTCTAQGYTTYTCSCGDSYKDNYTAALGHDWDNGTVTKAPTEASTGVRTYICMRCYDTRTETIPAIGHIHNYAAIVTAPTCTERGYTTRICVCGESYRDSYTNALGHNYADGKCTRCGAIDPGYKPPVLNPFTDIGSLSKSFQTAILWASSNGIAAGTSATTYNPNGACTRGQVVTFLWRAAGKPEPTATNNPYNDVASSAYYYKAILWAAENGITAGYNNADGSKSFKPGDTVTRGQFVTFLWRYLGKPAPASTVNPFNDVNPGGFYNAILWGSENGIVAGYNVSGGMEFRPNSPCTRAHVAVFLYRAMA